MISLQAHASGILRLRGITEFPLFSRVGKGFCGSSAEELRKWGGGAERCDFCRGQNLQASSVPTAMTSRAKTGRRSRVGSRSSTSATPAEPLASNQTHSGIFTASPSRRPRSEIEVQQRFDGSVHFRHARHGAIPAKRLRRWGQGG
jgi:hypothetical protein